MKRRTGRSRVAQLGGGALWLSLALGVLRGMSMEAQSTCPHPPAFALLPQDEDYSYLRNPVCRRHRWEYQQLGSSDASYLAIGGEAREWYEGFRNALWGVGPQDDNGYLLQRLSAYGDLRVDRRVRLFAQLTNNSEWGRHGGPRPVIDESKLWVEQAFADITLASGASSKDTSLVMRVGRQEFHFGSGLLVDFRGLPNVRQAFDGVALLWKSARWDVHALVTRPVLNGTGFFDAPDAPHETFWGMYAVRTLSEIQGRGIDIYYLGLSRNPAAYQVGVRHETRHTIGTRSWGRGGAWDYNTQIDLQLGEFGDGKLRAWGTYQNAGYTFRSARFQPRVGVTAAATSGDNGDPSSPLGTFNPLFPTGAYYGQGVMNLNGPSNIVAVEAQIGVQLTKSVNAQVEYHNLWRTNLGDGIYDLSTNLLVSGKGNRDRYVGSQLSTGVYWQVDRHLSLSAVYNHFFAGPFLVEAVPPRRSVDYAATWATFRF